MARAGILYSDLANAAARLVAEGKNPTVDSVRVALGSTGSKSTIAPLLKRWKVEHQDAVVDIAQGLGLPGPLLQAMKGIHEKLQDDVQQQLEQARDAHHVALLAAHDATQQAEDEKRVLQEGKAALSTELDQVRESRTKLDAQYQAMAIRQAALQAEQDGTQQRLLDRAAEVTALNDQLTQARTQFDHYLDAAAEQRAQERQAAEQRVLRVEQELAGLRQQHLQQQVALSRYETRISQLQDNNSQLSLQLQDAEKSREACRTERDLLAYQLADMSADRPVLLQKVVQAQEAVTQLRIAMASQAGQMEVVTGQLARSDSNLEESDQLHLKLIEERAGLQARLAHCEQREQAKQDGSVQT
ncbi:DNA-binding protein [Actimicrobium sp. CCC2.4]|uniref:DNA-binding protein n=1 Tax=Actimicrobium sp. CCC2.4 TaxID=3048606 RepID=UPI002AC9173E|nr:DNA-binding protein [Actimicrobium sp. CCC2.4]MEB0136536.1 DNA-binding protein [Actimicrobium sp. CCC2.4]WPX30894.1 DNA-binding protein [Actimicrobium sp. CCC2.4]